MGVRKAQATLWIALVAAGCSDDRAPLTSGPATAGSAGNDASSSATGELATASSTGAGGTGGTPAAPAPDDQEPICNDPAVIFCDNFEARAIGSEDLGRDIFKNAGWNTSSTLMTVETEAAYTGSKGLLLLYPATPHPGDNGGSGYMESPFPQPWQQQTLYFRWYTKYSANWINSAIAEKHVYLFHGGGGTPMGIGHMMGGTHAPAVVLQGTDDPTKHQNLAPIELNDDQWYCLEYRVTLNDPASASNGSVEGWIDGVKHLEYTNVQVHAGEDNAAWSHFEFTGYWNCLNSDCSQGANTHPEMRRWHDNAVVSTQPIGCL